jgi:NAD+ synthase (glutamine-hydrolysing)
MARKFKVALAQLNLRVGDVTGNAERMLDAIREARDTNGADLLVFQELALCGYPPEDLLFHAGLQRQVEAALTVLRDAATGITVVVGFPDYTETGIYNAAAVLADGRELARYHKWCLPNYSVFDEQRYFVPGDAPLVFEVAGVRIGITICEDIWEAAPCAAAASAGAQLLVALNGSPYELHKQARREDVARARCIETGLPLAYQNLVGGQDELVFDGGSFVMSSEGDVFTRACAFEESLVIAEFRCTGSGVEPLPGIVTDLAGDEESIYRALVHGVRDYVHKNGFSGVVLGLSGGIDSALTLAIAVDALGKDGVEAVMMPYRYTADMSQDDAASQAATMGATYRVIPIEDMVASTTQALSEVFRGMEEDTTEENIQSRCRGMLLMAISNKTGRIVLATGNKSEMAVGYATLYGDMAGGFAPIKDCTKSQVYRLARYRNSISPVIPERVIERPPSAELKPDQKDTDSLPPYDVLDAILDALMIDDLSVHDIADRGFDKQTVGEILSMVRRNEYKRRQAPPGVRITRRAFGRDWRYPITSGYRHR